MPPLAPHEAGKMAVPDYPVGLQEGRLTATPDVGSSTTKNDGPAHATETPPLAVRRQRPTLRPIQIPDASCLRALAIPPVPTSPDAPRFPNLTQ